MEIAKKELRSALVSKEQSQEQLCSALRRSASELQSHHIEANQKRNELAQKFEALETDYRMAQDALQESKKVISQLEGTLSQERASCIELSLKLEKEVASNEQLRKEVSRANQTIGKLKTQLDKQVTVGGNPA